MVRPLFIMLLLLIGCSELGIRSYDCPYPNDDFIDLAMRFLDEEPEAFDVLDRTEIICINKPFFISYGQRVAGVADWPGNPQVPARMRIATEGFLQVEDGAAAHEFMHLYLWDVFNDPCASHEEVCGWDEELIKYINDGS